MDTWFKVNFDIALEYKLEIPNDKKGRTFKKKNG